MTTRTIHLASFAAVLGLAGAFGCYTGPSLDPDRAAGGRKTDVNATETTSGALSGIPCDVAEVLSRSCASCHGTPLIGGAPNRMTTREDLVTISRDDPSRSIAQMSVQRMKDTAKPMPPSGPAPEADIAVLEKWIAAGMPAGSCDRPIEGNGGEYDTELVCTSGMHWTRGDHGSALMKPGGACIDCHTKEGEGERYTAAGTVYATAHEPDDCNGVAQGAVKVILTGADGKETSMTVNGAGNFGTRASIKMPYRAKVVDGAGNTREMITPQKDGDCNKCHTSAGAEKAPGRVMAPRVQP